jgi:hypothetical protein
MPKEPKASHASDKDDDYHGVPEAEVNAWAERVRRRRQAWLEGPQEEEKRAWAARQSRRHAINADEEDDLDLIEGRRVLDRMQIDAALALYGAANLLLQAPYRLVGGLVRSGRAWEDEALETLRRRRRVRLDDED